jgi:hypothetical protein
LSTSDLQLSGDPTEIGKRHKAKRLCFIRMVEPVDDTPDLSERWTMLYGRKQGVEALGSSGLSFGGPRRMTTDNVAALVYVRPLRIAPEEYIQMGFTSGSSESVVNPARATSSSAG